MSPTAQQLFERLLQIHGPQQWWPIYHPITHAEIDIDRLPNGEPAAADHRWQIMLGAVLTQNTAWRNVKNAIFALQDAHIVSAHTLLETPVERLEELIRPSGYFRQKTRKLHILAKATIDHGWLENQPAKSPSRQDLLRLWGVGPETADSILLYAFGFPLFVIDAYTRRILDRVFSSLDHTDNQKLLPKNAEYHQLQNWFHHSLSKQAPIYNEYHALFVRHAVEFCSARPKCAACPLQPDFCKNTQKTA